MNVFVAALDWGLGHTTRIMPIIHDYSSKNHRVIIGATKTQLTLYKQHFPNHTYIKIASNSPRYAEGNSQIISILFYLPKFIFVNFLDRIKVRKVAKRYGIELIISDNRYGFYNKKLKSIILTHQLNPILPKGLKFLEKAAQKKIHRYLNSFNECWIPDNEYPNNIAGKLSFPAPNLKCKAKYIGLISRMTDLAEEPKLDKSYPELLILISGPENQRTVFENILLKSIQTEDKTPNYLIIRGTNSKIKLENSIDFPSPQELKLLIKNSKYIICRAGYSTIMDLLLLKKTAMLVPTPGQSEQEYLAEYLSNKNLFVKCTQESIHIGKIINQLESFSTNFQGASR